MYISQQLFQSHPQLELTEKIIKTIPDNSLDNIFMKVDLKQQITSKIASNIRVDQIL